VISKTLKKLNWANSTLVKANVAEKVAALKEEEGPDLQVYGSGNMIQTLLQNDLVDEFWLKIYPVILGKGKRLFGEGTIPAAFTLKECQTTPHGVIIASYERAGDVQTGSFM
jgi:dihydrofolate reductase